MVDLVVEEDIPYAYRKFEDEFHESADVKMLLGKISQARFRGALLQRDDDRDDEVHTISNAWSYFV